MTEFDTEERAALHAAVAREAGGNFWIWAFERRIPFVEVAEAAHMGGVVSERVRAAVEKEKN